jgi:hypothetical protein
VSDDLLDLDAYRKARGERARRGDGVPTVKFRWKLDGETVLLDVDGRIRCRFTPELAQAHAKQLLNLAWHARRVRGDCFACGVVGPVRPCACPPPKPGCAVHLGWKGEPLCKQRTRHRKLTVDLDRVTCKRCLALLAKTTPPPDEAA